MVQRARIAPASDLHSVRKRGRKGPTRPAQAALKHLAALLLLAALVYAAPKVLGSNFFYEQARAALGAAAVAGAWLRFALAAAFQSIPVWW